MALPGRALDPKFPHITRNNIGVVVRRMAEADRDALTRAALIYENAMKVAVEGGFTTGNYYTATLRKSITHSPASRDERGGFIYVGTNLPYAKHWEFGFNRRLWVWYDEKKDRWYSRPGPTVYERVEKWRPTLAAKSAEMVSEYRRVYAKRMAQSAGGAA